MVRLIGGQDARRPVPLATLLKPGTRVLLRVDRDGVQKDISVLVEKRPADFGSQCSTVEHLMGPEFSTPKIFSFRVPDAARAPGAPRTPSPTTPPDIPAPPAGFAYAFTPMAMTSFIAGARLQALDEDWRESTRVDEGVLVTSVAQGSPARDAGLRGADVIVSADDQAVASPRALSRIISNAKTNAVKLQIIRAGKPQTLTLRLQERER